MKNIVVVALLVLVNSAFGQDYCKMIKKEVTDKNTSFSYESPYKEDSMPALRAVRNYSTNPEAEFDNFNLILTIPCEFSDLLGVKDGVESEKEETGIVIEFDDKTKIEEDISISHDKKPNGTANRIAYFPIGPDALEPLTTKKIVKFSLATAHMSVSPAMAIAIQKYIICMRDAKK